jgi:hypothetical protein
MHAIACRFLPIGYMPTCTNAALKLGIRRLPKATAKKYWALGHGTWKLKGATFTAGAESRVPGLKEKLKK